MPRIDNLAKGRADQLAEHRARAKARIEDTEFLLAHGEHLDNIIRRIGFPTAGAADKFFRRHGRQDLATLFSIHRRSEKRRAA